MEASNRTSGRLKASVIVTTASGSYRLPGGTGRDSVGCIILGRGEDDTRVREWLTTAATVPGFIGFAVGRTSFWDPLVNWRSNKISCSSASSLTGPRSSSGRRRNR